MIIGPDGTKYRLVKLAKPALATKERKATAVVKPAALAILIDKAVKSGLISGRALARRAGITNATLVQLKKGKRKRVNAPTVRAVMAIMSELGVI
ncbi:MAG: hypothetical protein KF799_01155 [Bdellovibrionales bacterium]|nr:hypothetical protein [Bdellovibrionales bacterium]